MSLICEIAMLNYACRAGEACKGWRRLYSRLYGECSGQDNKSSLGNHW